jgi:hypothetical protein
MLEGIDTKDHRGKVTLIRAFLPCASRSGRGQWCPFACMQVMPLDKLDRASTYLVITYVPYLLGTPKLQQTSKYNCHGTPGFVRLGGIRYVVAMCLIIHNYFCSRCEQQKSNHDEPME